MKSESGHTPGPWMMYGHEDRVDIHVRRSEGKGARIAHTVATSDVYTGCANARLIAAAPDMLEALRKAKQFIENGVELGFIHMPDMTIDPAHGTLPAIDAAIAKATVSP